jgi:hypothetical protein
MNLDEIRDRHAKATRGPWVRSKWDVRTIEGGEDTRGPGQSVKLLRMYPDHVERLVDGTIRVMRGPNGQFEIFPVFDAQCEADVEFVAHAWEDVRALIEELEEFRNLFALQAEELRALREPPVDTVTTT